jgi:hypothetical protein
MYASLINDAKAIKMKTTAKLIKNKEKSTTPMDNESQRLNTFLLFTN